MTRVSFRERLKLIGEPRAGQAIPAFPSGFHDPPRSLRAAMDAMRPPRISEWTEHARTEVSSGRWRQECGGIASDGSHWFVSTNIAPLPGANDPDDPLARGFGGVFKLAADLGVITYAGLPGSPHVGDLDFYDGKLYVPLSARRVAVFIVLDNDIFMDDAVIVHYRVPDRDVL